MNLRSGIAACIGLLLILLSSARLDSADRLVQQVVKLKHRSATELVPPLRRFLEESGYVTAYGETLIIRVRPDALTKVNQFIKELDKPHRNLIISVLHTADATIVDEALLGESISESNNGASLRIHSTQGLEENSPLLKVKVLEGHTAFVRLGRTVPDAQVLWIENANRQPIPYSYLTQREFSNGFYVRAKLAGDRVIVQASYFSEQPARDTHYGDQTQDIHTTVAGSLGQWLDLGGNLQINKKLPLGHNYSVQHWDDNKTRVLVKVELAL